MVFPLVVFFTTYAFLSAAFNNETMWATRTLFAMSVPPIGRVSERLHIVRVPRLANYSTSLGIPDPNGPVRQAFKGRK